MAKSQGQFWPQVKSLEGWVGDEDLRLIHQRAPLLAREFRLQPGQGLLVTNKRFGKVGELFRLIVRGSDKTVWVLTPPRGNLLLSLFVRVHEFQAQLNASEAA